MGWLACTYRGPAGTLVLTERHGCNRRQGSGPRKCIYIHRPKLPLWPTVQPINGSTNTAPYLVNVALVTLFLVGSYWKPVNTTLVTV